MTERKKKLDRVLHSIFAGSLVLAVMFVVSCDSGDDIPKPELYEIPGVYTFKEATLQTTVTINIGALPITVPAGEDITEEMSGGLLAEANCEDAANGAVELKANQELFFTCISENNETKAGSWNINGDSTELTLNLASPPLPSAIPLKIEDLEINRITDVISGSILNFPLTPDLMLGFLPAQFTDGKSPAELEVLKALFDAVTLVDVDIAFQKVSE
jgi:hypothetical protein